ncbi:MAG: YkvA family protein [Candidatus Methylacidiphilales bacterium]|nr:YkvA family protein [Candidatus Methylacidiphilales bacterium]
MTARLPRKAQSLTSFITQGASALTLEQLEAFPNRVPALKRKLGRLRKEGHTELDHTAQRLLAYALAALLGQAKPFHPRTMFSAIFALNYLLKGFDAIPDSVPKIGLADDLIILKHVTREHDAVLRAFEAG